MASTLENDAAKDDELNGELYNAILNEEVENVIKLCERFADHAMHRLTIHKDAEGLLSMRNELAERVLFQAARYGKINIFNFLAD